MFTYNEETRLYWFVADGTMALSQAILGEEGLSDVVALQPRLYKLVGTLLGLATYNNHTLDCAFPPLLYKKLLCPEGEATLEDLEAIDPAVRRARGEEREG